MPISKERLGALHRKIRELQALLRAVQLAQDGAGDDLAQCMITARKLLSEVDSELYLFEKEIGSSGQ